MERDPIVEEVRKIREAHAAKFGYDIAAICREAARKVLAGTRTRHLNGPVISRGFRAQRWRERSALGAV